MMLKMNSMINHRIRKMIHGMFFDIPNKVNDVTI